MSQTRMNISDSPGSPANSLSQFIPKELPTNKDVNGISRTVFTHVSNVHGFLHGWVRVQDKGAKICKSIAALELHECSDGYYPSAMQPLSESLVEALASLKNYVEGIGIVDRQLQSLAKLQKTEEPVILTWSAKKISTTVTDLRKALEIELRLKEVITENIAHCRDENLLEVYTSSWEFNVYLDLQSSTSYLFAEVGLPGIT